MKIIASDFDGTFRRHGEISESDIEAVRKWQAAGNLFGFSTGRGYSAIRNRAESLGVDFIVCCGGGAVYSGKGDLIWEKTYDREALEKILEIADRMNISHCTAYSGMDRWGVRDNFEKLPLTDDIKNIQVCSFASAEKETSRAFADEVNRLIPEYAKAHLNGRHIDLVASGVTKSSGIRALMEAYGVKEEDVITVGDNYNDYDMIRDFHGVTVPNGVDAIKEISRKVYNDFTELVEDNL
jgi:Cof subfamily protein (haloacid dehalogenase superfamily)